MKPVIDYWARMRDAAAFAAGEAEAKRDIAASRLRYFSGAPSQASWGLDLAETLRSRFGIEVEFTSDITDIKTLSFEDGYDHTVEIHVESLWGKGALQSALNEVQQRRVQRYDAWRAAQEGQP